MGKTTLDLGAILPNTASAQVFTETKDAGKYTGAIKGEQQFDPIKAVVGGSNGSVSLKLGVTVGLPNYCGVRVDVGVDVPLEEGDDLEEVYQKAHDWAMGKLQAETDTLTKGMNGE